MFHRLVARSLNFFSIAATLKVQSSLQDERGRLLQFFLAAVQFDVLGEVLLSFSLAAISS